MPGRARLAANLSSTLPLVGAIANGDPLLEGTGTNMASSKTCPFRYQQTNRSLTTKNNANQIIVLCTATVLRRASATNRAITHAKPHFEIRVNSGCDYLEYNAPGEARGLFYPVAFGQYLGKPK